MIHRFFSQQKAQSLKVGGGEFSFVYSGLEINLSRKKFALFMIALGTVTFGIFNSLLLSYKMKNFKNVIVINVWYNNFANVELATGVV